MGRHDMTLHLRIVGAGPAPEPPHDTDLSDEEIYAKACADPVIARFVPRWRISAEWHNYLRARIEKRLGPRDEIEALHRAMGITFTERKEAM